jgi:hypothetical protein
MHCFTNLCTSFLNPPMHAMSPSQLILLDFATLYDMIYIFNRSWVDTRWQQYITTLTLCGEQCILLQHSVHFQLQQVRKHITHCATFVTIPPFCLINLRIMRQNNVHHQMCVSLHSVISSTTLLSKGLTLCRP